jgi:hypothetical protein
MQFGNFIQLKLEIRFKTTPYSANFKENPIFTIAPHVYSVNYFIGKYRKMNEMSD